MVLPSEIIKEEKIFLKVLNYKPRILYPAKLSFKNKHQTFPDIQKLREYFAGRNALQEILKGVLPAEMRGHY